MQVQERPLGSVAPLLPTASPSRPNAPRRRHPRLPAHPPAHHWLGPFYCATEACGTILAEIFADAQGTYLANLGGRPVRAAAIECPACGATRQFRTRPAGGSALAGIAPPAESEYDLGNPNAAPPNSDGPSP